jgi:3D (Asp-Asp-Asp) domain-containing protein/peptidoglycan hydrolase CwlO-like protein
MAALAGSASAGSGGNPTLQLKNLRDQEAQALLDLYAADSALARASSRVGRLTAATATLRGRVSAARAAVAVGDANLAAARRTLMQRVAANFRAGTPDPLAIVLGARSLQDAIDSITLADRAAARDAEVLHDVQTGVRRARQEAAALQTAQQRLQANLAQASAEQQRLAAARAAKVTLIADLRTQEHVATGRIAQLEAAAEQARVNGDRVSAPSAQTASGTPPPAPSSSSSSSGGTPPPPPSTDPGSTLSVVSTAYDLPGTTATGIPVRHGVCATDPRVIPLGTRFTVPGYGVCVAADTGSAVIGRRIDVWVATATEAQNWGTRTVTITFQ